MARHAKQPAEDSGALDVGQLRGFLQTLGETVDAVVVQLVPADDGLAALSWARESSEFLAQLATGFARRWLHGEPAWPGAELPHVDLELGNKNRVHVNTGEARGVRREAASKNLNRRCF